MMSKKRRAARPAHQAKKPRQGVYLSEYEITWDPLPDARQQLPEPLQEAIQRLHDEIHTQPAKTIPELRELIEQYPNVPLLYNYLANAYHKAGQPEEAEKIVHENYRQNPDYLFARLNYAELCFATGDYDKIAEIFERKFDLKTLYPKRNVFHITEVTNFMGIIGAYFVMIGERHAAEVYYDALKQLAPDHPLTRRLKGMLFPNVLQRWLQRMEKKLNQE